MESMAIKDEKELALKPGPSPTAEPSHAGNSQTSNKNQNEACRLSKMPMSPKDFMIQAAANIASQPLQNYDTNVWGVLTAISNNARKRPQGSNILLSADEHCIGRLVDDLRFQIESTAVSANHCKIYRKVIVEDVERTSVFLKDTSTNGTYLNWGKLKKNGPETKICHGDILSLAAPPQHELAFAFVYREVLRSTPSTEGVAAKRKAEDFASENKRLKGIGIGAPEGPISLDDFRSLQRSNKELRKQLESQVLTIDALRNDNRTTIEHHENEIKGIKESITKSFHDQLEELHTILDVKKKELKEISKLSAEQKHTIEDLNEILNASMQSCSEANEIMKSQKASIADLKAQLDEEQHQRREEREKAAIDLKLAVQKAQIEVQEELKRFSDDALRREKEQQEVINKLKELEKQSSLQLESLLLKLEDTRQKLVLSDNKTRQLETQVCEQQLATANERKKVEELEHEIKTLRKELESEKAAREEAWAKVSSLELEINAAMRDLDFERQRLKGARERIMLRETQLRAFYSTTEEISVLFAKQQEQLKAMQRTLEDEENYENTSVDMEINAANRNINDTLASENERAGFRITCAAKASSSTSAKKFGKNQIVTSSDDEISVTEKHDCGIRSQEGQNTQEAEYTSPDHLVNGGFGSDIDGLGTVPVLEGDIIGTECVLETESAGIDCEQDFASSKCDTLGGETMQLDGEAHVLESTEHVRTVPVEALNQSESNNPPDNQKAMEETEGGEETEVGGTIRTADLLASEVAGSWACSTAPSVHGENESPGCRDGDEDGIGGLLLSTSQVAESQSTTSSRVAAIRKSHVCAALSEMIGMVAPDMKEQFVGATDVNPHEDRDKQNSGSNSDTEGCTDNDDNNVVDGKDGSISDTETEDSNEADNDIKHAAMEEDDEATQQDSVG